MGCSLFGLEIWYGLRSHDITSLDEEVKIFLKNISSIGLQNFLTLSSFHQMYAHLNWFIVHQDELKMVSTLDSIHSYRSIEREREIYRSPLGWR
jgi:hypothetical protein